jgi:hypothetical protein
MVMAGATDMSTPVTRGELRAELAQLEIRLEQKLEEKLEQKLEEKLEQKLEQRLAHLATKAELETWGGALLARIDGIEQRFNGIEQRFDGFEQRFDGFEQRLLTELARHTRAISESMSMQISVIDERYADLPPRVSRLEAEVFDPERR